MGELVGRILVDRRVRYLLSGGASAALYYGCFSAGWLLSHGHVPYLLLALVSNVVTALLTYPLYRRTFGPYDGPWLHGFSRFYVICLWSLAFNVGGLPLLIEVFGVPVLLAQFVLIVAGPVVNYQLLRVWAFRSRRHRSPVRTPAVQEMSDQAP